MTNADTASYVTGSVFDFTNPATSASYALTASYAMNGGGGGGTTFNGGTNVDNRIVTATGTSPELNGEANLTFNGSTLTITGNVTASSFTGSLQGTSSWATNALTASYLEGGSSGLTYQQVQRLIALGT